MAKRPSMPRPVALKEVIQGLLRPGDWDSLEQRRQIRLVWEKVLPPHLLAQTRLIDVRRKELWVQVSASAYGQELQFLKPVILQELAKVLGLGVIRDLRFQVGED